jgi:hypothetical protein
MQKAGDEFMASMPPARPAPPRKKAAKAKSKPKAKKAARKRR